MAFPNPVAVRRVRYSITAALLAFTVCSVSVSAAGPVYPDVSSAHADIDAAMTKARAERKRVIVDFGGNWCGDCKVLDANFHKSENAALLESGFVLVHVNVVDKAISENF